MAHFNPISLYNAFYKIISKTMANRLKRVFPDFISPHQGTLVKDRQILNNIIIFYKVFRFLRKDKSCNPHMTTKIDISKVYDRVEWDMIYDMMERVGFNSKWIGWVKIS